MREDRGQERKIIGIAVGWECVGRGFSLAVRIIAGVEHIGVDECEIWQIGIVGLAPFHARFHDIEPEIAPEAVSALDVSVQAQIIDLLIELQAEFDLAMIFISHDLAVVREISHRIMVLYLGRVVEIAGRDAIYEDPRHPYTKSLIAAVPNPDPRAEKDRDIVKLQGDLPSPLDRRATLRFMKSKLVDDADTEQYRPQLIEVGPGHVVAEHDPSELSDGLLAS